MAFKGNDKGDEPQPTQTAKTDKDVLHQEAVLTFVSLNDNNEIAPSVSEANVSATATA